MCFKCVFPVYTLTSGRKGKEKGIKQRMRERGNEGRTEEGKEKRREDESPS